MKEELLKGLSEEQIAKLKECKNQEEMLAMAKEEGIELNDEQLEAVSGGCSSDPSTICPKCGSNDCHDYSILGGARWHKCNECKYEWQTDIYSGQIVDSK